MPVSYQRYCLFDIGQVINNLMGGAYQSSYCRKKFRVLYYTVMNKVLNTLMLCVWFCQNTTPGSMVDLNQAVSQPIDVVTVMHLPVNVLQ